MTSREILTIQLGHYSNFIGTHWWNLQESNFSYDPNNPSEINHDVLYREGENFKKQLTYTPRLLLVDLKGSCGYLKQEGSLYSIPRDEETKCLWDEEKVEVTKEEAATKSSFVRSLEEPTENFESTAQNLEDYVNWWVDYLVPRFHPRTVNIIKEYKHGCTTQPFNIFTYGRSLWNTEQFSEDFADRIRAYVEECDLMQGFQIILDSVDGFAGLGTSCMQYLKDEYEKSILSFPCIDSKTSEPSVSNLIKSLNTALCWQHAGEYSSLYSPLCCGEAGWPQAGEPRAFNHLIYDAELKYHSSALLATALDTLTIRYRRKEYPNVVLSDLCADLNQFGRQAVATSLTLPFPMMTKMDLIDVLDEFEGTLWTSLTPSCEIPMDRNMQSVVLRGISEDRLKRPISHAMKQMSKPAYRCSSVHEMMMLYLACTCHASATYLSTISSPLSIKEPFPKIFNNDITENGEIARWPVGTDVQSVPVMAGLHSGSSLGKMYESLHELLSKIKSIKKFHAFTESGLEEDEFKECLDHLLDCKENYEDHYS
ncbi:misato mitochondrial distribution and morphology regulator [Megachile rotundata]|uniref:misato mitochondrial distribution and morphology regulator n=1 Tax=Megachile rotundata TaxID=143995 RepID=UPI000258F78C|nr:PREDICTED: protein misato [Megachile rotundata]